MQVGLLVNRWKNKLVCESLIVNTFKINASKINGEEKREGSRFVQKKLSHSEALVGVLADCAKSSEDSIILQSCCALG